MPRFIVHHEGYFFEWSTVVDAPVTAAMTREEFVEYYTRSYGELAAQHELPARLERAVEHGTSSLMAPTSAREMMSYNRAGPKEESMKFENIIEMVHEWRK